MPAVPALIMAGGAIGSAYVGSRAANSARKQAGQRSPEELALMNSQRGLADQQARQGRELFGSSMPGVRSTLDYYGTLLSGNRGAQQQMVAPEAEGISDAYRGADRAVSNRLVGGERDQALAENARERAGRISRLITGVRPGAASAMSGLTQGLIGASSGFSGQAAGINSGLLANETENRQQANRAGQDAGSGTAAQMGQLLSMLVGSLGGGRGGGGGRPLASRNLIPSGTSSWMPPNVGGSRIGY